MTKTDAELHRDVLDELASRCEGVSIRGLRRVAS